MNRSMTGALLALALVLSAATPAAAQPCVPETCNGLDDDCDGKRDGFSAACYSFAAGCKPKSSGVGYDCIGFCKPGTKTCTAQQVTGGAWTGVWGGCTAEVGPAPEICNGLDDDCDSVADNKATCPAGATCVNGACRQPCNRGGSTCPKGQLCSSGWCIPDPCVPAKCPSGQICKDGQCYDPCNNVTCGKYETCVKGVCVDTSCYNPANTCGPGQTCIKGSCQTDPCAGFSCGPGAYCDQGTCLKLCDKLACPAGKTCKVTMVVGRPTITCVADPCASTSCGSGQVCVGGTCVVDPCAAVTCERGQVCKQGACSADPCETIRCPAGYACKDSTCVSSNPPPRPPINPPPPDETVPDRGCSCEVGGADVAPPFALLLLVLGWIKRRWSAAGGR